MEGTEAWGAEKQEAFEKAIKEWTDLNGRLPTLEEEMAVWERLAFPETKKEDT